MNINKKILGTVCAIGVTAILIVQSYYPINSILFNRPIEVQAATDDLNNRNNVNTDQSDMLEENTSIEGKEETTQEEGEDSLDVEDKDGIISTNEDKNLDEINTGVENVNSEFRATWISTVYNLDWPSKKGLSVEDQKQEFISLLDGLQMAGLNSVIVQIKPSADSFYPSKYGPWSEYLTGVQGQDPGYNPLDFMIEETHKRNMEFHAWFNPYRVSVKGDLEALTEDHPARKNPDWVVSYGGKLFYNPGVPEVRQFVIDSILEVVKNYNIDGVHLDDYFYPYPEKNVDFPDEDLYKVHKRTSNETKEEWRRNNINDFIKNLYESIKNEKSDVVFGVSPFGIWRNKADDPKGSDTRGGVTSYDSLYADTKYWVENGWLDYIAPQLYWYIGYDRAEYTELVQWWANVVKNKKTHLYIGHAAYKVEEGSTPWGNPLEISNQIEYNRGFAEVKGSIFFRAKSIMNNPLGLKDKLQNEIYKEKVKTPNI